MPKRFLLFVGPEYYPYGGAYDFTAAHDSLPALMAAHDTGVHGDDWAHIFDCETLSVIMRYVRGEWVTVAPHVGMEACTA